jgi:pyruvate, water dikinase
MLEMAMDRSKRRNTRGIQRKKSDRKTASGQPRYVVPLNAIGMKDTAVFGGKNASLGEMIQHLRELGIAVPEGFATTADAYRLFIKQNKLGPLIQEHLGRWRSRRETLEQCGKAIRSAIGSGTIPNDVAREILDRWEILQRKFGSDTSVAVRSSATAEDAPAASFAGQLETSLNIRGQQALLAAVRNCFASLFTDRAITYCATQKIRHADVAVSAGVQRMVRSDRAGSGVMFTLDTETGFPDIVLINAAWGLGEFVVQGIADPDEYLVCKPLLANKRLMPIIERRRGQKLKKLVYGHGARTTLPMPTSRRERESLVLNDDEILTLARWAVAIERHYGRPMDIEWAKDGRSRELFIVQARPETVQSRKTASALKTYSLKRKGEPILSGLAIGSAIATGKVCRLRSASEGRRFPDGAVLVAQMTDPDWGPIMKRASAIITAHGGRTSHAAIVSRELGLPAIVGASSAMRLLKDGMEVTVCCAEGDEGVVYEGKLPFHESDLTSAKIPETRTRVMLNMGDPAAALQWWRLPADGIGLARMEFIIANHVKVHPMAVAHFEQVREAGIRKQIIALTKGYASKPDYFVDRLAEGIARLAASQYPRPVIVRLSDFKTNEYAKLIGGKQYEPVEPNPMIGWRGASRYYSDGYRDGFALECRAIRKVRDQIGLNNVVVMIPFCRTTEEADLVLKEMARHGLRRGLRGLEVYVMCEIPSNVILADQFAARFDGFSIGSNDLTQLALGVDRDSGALKHLFDEENPAVKNLIQSVISAAHRNSVHVGLCGQAPSDHPAFARFLVKAGIDAMSVTPDSFIAVKNNIAAAEAGGVPSLAALF